MDPVVLSPNKTVSDVYRIKQERGFCGIPVTGELLLSTGTDEYLFGDFIITIDTGDVNGKLLGLIAARDIDLIGKDRSVTPVEEVSGLLIII